MLSKVEKVKAKNKENVDILEKEDLTYVAHVLLNLLNELGKSDKMGGLPSILLLFPNEFNKFNNSGAQMLDSIYHMTLKLIKNRIFGVKTSRFCHLLRNVIMNVITFPENL